MAEELSDRFVRGDCLFVTSPFGRCRDHCPLSPTCPGYAPPADKSGDDA